MELEHWTQRYRESAGPAADPCSHLLEDLIREKMLTRDSADRMLELLVILDALSADPITISCAMLHAAGAQRTVKPDIIQSQPAEVRRQLEELNKLKHYESGQPLSGRNMHDAMWLENYTGYQPVGIGGDRSNYTWSVWYDPDFDVLIIEGSGHFPMREKRADFDRLLEQVIEEITSGETT